MWSLAASARIPNELRISYDFRTLGASPEGRVPPCCAAKALAGGAVRCHHVRAVRSVSEHDPV